MRFNRLSLKNIENISEVFLYRRLEFRYLLADVFINDISSGRNTDDKMTKLLNKILIIFYYVGAHLHVGILCRIPFSSYCSELYIPPFLKKTPYFCRVTLSPFY